MADLKQRQTGWQFADLVNTAIYNTGCSVDQFARQHQLDPGEVKSVVNGEAINSAIVIPLLNSLKWTAGEVQEYLHHLDPIPLTDGRQLKLTPRGADKRRSPDLQTKPGPLLVAFTDPKTLECRRVELLRESDDGDVASSVFTHAYIERHIIGHSWMRLYNAKEISAYAEQLRNIQDDQPADTLFVESSIGMLRLSYSKAGTLVRIQTDVLDQRVVPLQRGIRMGLKSSELLISTDHH